MVCSCATTSTASAGHTHQLVTLQPSAYRPEQAHLQLSEGERSRLLCGFDGGYTFLPVELFTTETGHYAFDANNVCFFKVDTVAFDVLSILRIRNATLQELQAVLPQYSESELCRAYEDLRALQAGGMLVPYHFRRIPNHENDEYEAVLSERMAGFTIFVTTECNLSCSYCIYGGQYDQHEKLSQTMMPWSTLANTMRFLQSHSLQSKRVRLDFFGGEPLLAFDMIKAAVEYLKSIIEPGGPEVVVTITSNGTVITDQIIDFALSHNVFLQFSIDGSRESHDANRAFKVSNRGSFHVICRNLQRIYDRDSSYFCSHMRVKAVITTATLDNDDVEFFTHPLIKILLDGGSFSFLNEEPHYDLAKDDDYFERMHKLGRMLLRMRGLSSEADIIARLNVRQGVLYQHLFGTFFNAQAVNELYFAGMDSTPFVKGCLTGFQEGAVSANGDISICLKSAKGTNFVIGNVNEGRWYYEKIRELNTVFHQDWSGCSSCFVQKMCDLCYEKLNGEKGQFAAGRAKFCTFNRARYRLMFEYMLRVMEQNPELWVYLNKVLKDQISLRRQVPPKQIDTTLDSGC